MPKSKCQAVDKEHISKAKTEVKSINNDKSNQLNVGDDKNGQTKGDNNGTSDKSETVKEDENKDGKKEKTDESKGTKEFRCKLMAVFVTKNSEFIPAEVKENQVS